MSSRTIQTHLDRATALCLACSSSLPPRKAIAASSSSAAVHTSDEIFVTRCCGRPICPACISKNQRLARYYPCLHCLGGAEAVSSRNSTGTPALRGTDHEHAERNVDGSVWDDDVFAIGDDDEDDLDENAECLDTDSDMPPVYERQPVLSSESAVPAEDAVAVTEQEPDVKEDRKQSSDSAESSGSPIYYIKPSDTLLGIALKFGLDAHAVCRLNDLPPSTIRTTPHLLHTRAYLTLPLTLRTTSLPTAAPAAADTTRQRAQAELRFFALTREADEHIARAYVAVADVHEDEGDRAAKMESAGAKGQKRQGQASASGRPEERAMERYYDDEEWETRERREGRSVSLPQFPMFSVPSSAELKGQKAAKWWQW